ncbi:hypothetical protein HYW58_00930 [Candidatus Kaiserbacteria bacterium]|nr:hypothetical protein [Candidatus Kaiserbacteria bacterium]
MSRNPFLNALLAILYISIVTSIMYYGPKITAPKETVIVPIAFLSLFVLSASVMGFLFFYQPFQLYFNGEKTEAFKLFIQTTAIFAGITALIFIALFSGILS